MDVHHRPRGPQGLHQEVGREWHCYWPPQGCCYSQGMAYSCFLPLTCWSWWLCLAIYVNISWFTIVRTSLKMMHPMVFLSNFFNKSRIFSCCIPLLYYGFFSVFSFLVQGITGHEVCYYFWEFENRLEWEGKRVCNLLNLQTNDPFITTFIYWIPWLMKDNVSIK